MKNIINLVKLQYSSIYSIKKYLYTIISIALIMTVFDRNFIMFASGMVTMGLIYSTAFYEEKSKMNYLIYSLPVKPKDFVLAKYIYGFLNTLLVMLLSGILFMVLNILNIGRFTQLTFGSISLSTFFIGFIITILVLPFALILGFEKGRLIIVFLVVLPICFAQSLIQCIGSININPTITLIAITLFVIISTVLSYIITSNLYIKKDIN
ncbi:TPA: ABC-2 transporter permease [Clostridium botulinum]|nr:ABC-2 transporter permease [Clostridium botulinum]